MTLAGEFFFTEQLKVSNMTVVLLLIGADVVLTRTKVIAELNTTRASYAARVAVKRRRARARVISSTGEAWVASSLMNAVTSSAQDDRGRAIRASENGTSSADDRGKGQIFGNSDSNVCSLLGLDGGRTASSWR